MRDHYRFFDHPVLELLQATTDLFSEMNNIADELRNNPRHILEDDQIAFRQLQKARLPHLTREQWLDLFELWRDYYQARREAKETKDRARVAKLGEELNALLSESSARSFRRTSVRPRTNGSPPSRGKSRTSMHRADRRRRWEAGSDGLVRRAARDSDRSR
jgi:hypothetical protein